VSFPRYTGSDELGMWRAIGRRWTTVKRFDQLAELRTGIRHSRTVDDITRKAGEAALSWFQQVFAR
jgi:hypothetical protein